MDVPDDREASRQRSLAEAFSATDYRVVVDGQALSLRVGARSATLEARLTPGTGWGWLTAVNPGAQRLRDDQNAARLAALRAQLRHAGITHWPADAVADAGDWPAEAGFVVAGLRLTEARALAAAYGQTAILWSESGTPARLEWLVCP